MTSEASPSPAPQGTPPPGPEASAPPTAGPGPGEPSPGSEPAGPPEITRLLVKAVGLLDAGERDSVYAYLMERGLTAASPMARQLRASLAHDAGLNLSGGRLATTSGGQISGQQLVPVRFAADQHAALRAWCAEHGFSMATVIRGLVARFLEGQGQLPARE